MRSASRFSALILLVLSSYIGIAQNPPDSNNDPLVIVQNGRYGYIDHSGNIVIPPIFFWADAFQDGFAKVFICGRSVWIDPTGRVASRPNKLWFKKSGTKFGFVDEYGVFRIPPTFDETRGFYEGLAAARVGENWGFIATSGNWVIEPRYNDAKWFHNGFAEVETGDRTALIDRHGNVIATGDDFFLQGLPEEQRIPVERDHHVGYLDYSGKVAIPLEYDWAATFSEGLAKVSKGSKWGFVDTSGRLRIPIRFDEADEFHHGLAPVRVGDEFGFIDQNGQFVFHLSFEQATSFIWGDIARFWTADQQFGYVNTSGKVVWGPTREQPDHFPLIWDDSYRTQSCRGIPNDLRVATERFPLD